MDQQEITRLRALLKECDEVLGFYAAHSNWTQSDDDIDRGHVGFSQIEVDEGTQARALREKLKTKLEGE